MKLTVIKLIASILLGLALINYMSRNSSSYNYIIEKYLAVNESTPNNKSVVTLRKRKNVPTVKIAMQDYGCFYYS